MAQRRRIVEGTWQCASCGTQGVLGRHKTCPSCGNPRDSRSEMQFAFGTPTASGGTDAETVADPALLAQAAAGADWPCPFCGSANPGTTQACRNCNGPRPQPTVRGAVAAPPALRSRLGKGCAVSSGCGCLSLIGLFLAFLALGWWGSRTHEVPGQAVERSWARESAREVFTRVTREGWQDEIRPRRSVMPARGGGEVAGVEAIRECTRRQRGTRKVADGSREVCEDVRHSVRCGTEERCTTRDLGNGFAEEVCDDVPTYCDETRRECRAETRYREEPVFGTLCRYDTWEWRPAARLHEKGGEEAPRWPARPVADLEREKRTETYEVVLEYRDGSATKRHVHRLASEDEFRAWVRGRRAVLTIDNLGTVKSVRSRP